MNFSLLIPLALLILFAFLPRQHEKACREKGREYTDKMRRCVGRLCTASCIFVLLVFMVAIAGQVNMYRQVITAYKTGTYQTVQGYVENFSPMPKGGHAEESFDIQDVHFEYSDYQPVTGYHRARVNGGVITGDGQYLKVGYVYVNRTYGNIIVYIEALEVPET